MNVTIIGTGKMARGLATRALAAGYEVTVRGTSGQNAEALAKVLPGPVEIASPADPITGDLVILAVPYFAVDTILGAYPGSSTGRSSSTSRTPSTSQPSLRSPWTSARPPARSRPRPLAPGW